MELDELDARAFRRAVGPLTPRIERSLGPGVFANRTIGRGTRSMTALEPWGRAWTRWRRSALAEATDGSRLLRADVADFYPSVGERAIRLSLGDGTDEALRVLRSFWDGGVAGLPIGPEPSAILANAVLAYADAALRGAGSAPIRWVDDWLIPVPDRRAADRSLVALEAALAELGLRLNPSKTIVLDPEQVQPLFGWSGSVVLGSGRAMMRAP